MTTPAVRRNACVRYATAGVGTGPVMWTSTPAEEKPAPVAEAPRKGKRLARAVQKLAKVLPKVDMVPVASLTGPTIKSHPWKEMLAGKTPDVGRLSKCVPEDFYFVEFHSLVKLMEVMDQSDLWGTHLFNQSVQEARTQLVGERLKKQLAVETSTLLRPFYDAVVEEVGVAGSDLYLREGSDVSLLFLSKQPAVLKARMDGFLENAAKQEGAKRSEGEYLGVAFTHVATPDRSVHVYSAFPKPELHLRSNSKAGFERIVEAIVGKDTNGKEVRRLGDTDEFAYVRTLMPRGAKEDGFVYLSDPFIRRLVGPEVKLTERRRMVCYNHLRMIGHASLMYRTESGRPATSLDELVKGGCAPGLFGQGEFACPDGGKYSLAADGLTGVCSHHGHSHALAPCREIPVTQVGQEEAGEYKAFLEEYNRYWRTFFDPIALRIQLTPKRYRIETIVLPLIDNSVYTAMAGALGGKPEALDALPVPKRNIFSFAVRLNKRELLRTAGMEELLAEEKEEAKPAAPRGPGPDDLRMANNLRMLGLAMHNFHDAFNTLPGVVGNPQQKSELSWRVHLLPFLDEGKLYQEFHLDEPWDSEHNKTLIKRIPAIYRPANLKVAAEGKTGIVAPVGANSLFPPDRRRIRFADVQDGLSNTIMLVEADDAHAVVWTKPDDLAIDPAKPLNGLAMRPAGAFLALAGDGALHFIRGTTEPTTIAAMFTRSGGEVVGLGPENEIAIAPGRGDPFSRRHGPLGDLESDVAKRLKLGEMIAKGVGNSVAVHVCDAEPTFDFSVPQFFGAAVGAFSGRGPFGNEGVMIGFFVAALNAPVYVSVPVQDAKIVDDFLARLDGFLAQVSREKEPFGRFFRVEQDYYQFPGGKGKDFRAYGVRFGPVKWRFFWGRIGDGLYLASKPFILEEVMAVDARKGGADPGPAAHGMVRLRPQHWQRALADYKLGWAENNREACLNNVGPISSLTRGLNAGGDQKKEIEHLAERLYGVHFFCPEEGRYETAADGKSVVCSIHGTAASPKQLAAPAASSRLGKLLDEFADMTLALTFLEDGLHATVTIDRK